MGPRVLHYSDVENVYDEPERVGRLAGLLQRLDGDDAIVAGAGDDTSPGVLALHAEGRQAVPFFEAAGTDVETFGNHDFDYGPEAALEVVAESPQQWVGANVYRNGHRFGAGVGVDPWTLFDVDGGTVGVVGLTDPSTPSINPKADGVRFTDPVEAAREAIAAAREAGADYVVALSHLGDGDDDLAAEVDVDAVLGGHVHSERDDRVDGTVITRPGAGGHVVYEVDLATGKTTRHRVADAPVHEGVVETLAAYEQEAGLDEVVGRVDDPVERDEDVVFEGECRVGNFVADAYRWEADSDVGLQNSGGIRNGPPLAGAVTVADLMGLVPFEEPIVVAELTGAELRDVLAEMAASEVHFDEDGWWHGHVSGARVEFGPGGDLRSVAVGGDPLAESETYTLATSDYLLHTDHEFPSLTNGHRTATLDTQYDVVAEYASAVGIDPEVEGRLVQAD
jgi:UDP-sugar diphosphatase